MPKKDDKITVVYEFKSPALSRITINYPFDVALGGYTLSRSVTSSGEDNVFKVTAWGDSVSRIIELFRFNGTSTIPVPGTGDGLRCVSWFGDTAKTIIAALDFYRAKKSKG